METWLFFKMDEFEKGESIGRTVVLKEGTTILDTDDFDTIEVVVFNWLHRVAGTYSLAAGTVTLVDPTTSGQIFFVVPSATSSSIRAMKYFYRIKTTETDGDYPTGIRTRIYLGWCFKLKATK